MSIFYSKFFSSDLPVIIDMKGSSIFNWGIVSGIFQMFCSVDEERTAVELLSDTNVELAPDGTASWTTPALLKSACKINIDLYPFDVQVRSLVTDS